MYMSTPLKMLLYSVLFIFIFNWLNKSLQSSRHISWPSLPVHIHVWSVAKNCVDSFFQIWSPVFQNLNSFKILINLAHLAKSKDSGRSVSWSYTPCKCELGLSASNFFSYFCKSLKSFSNFFSNLFSKICISTSCQVFVCVFVHNFKSWTLWYISIVVLSGKNSATKRGPNCWSYVSALKQGFQYSLMLVPDKHVVLALLYYWCM